MLDCSHEFWSFTKHAIEQTRDAIVERLPLPTDILEIRLHWFLLVHNESDENILDLTLWSESTGDLNNRKYRTRCTLIFNREPGLLDVASIGRIIAEACEAPVYYGRREGIKVSNVPVAELEVLEVFDHS